MSNKLLYLLSAGSLAVGLAFLAANPAEASMTSRLQKCKYANKQQVIDCCQHIVKTKKPMWMIENNTSCKTAVTCAMKMVKVSTAATVAAPVLKPVKVCSIQMVTPGDGGGIDDTPPEVRDRPERRRGR